MSRGETSCCRVESRSVDETLVVVVIIVGLDHDIRFDRKRVGVQGGANEFRLPSIL
jgi:hypothetical protein